MDPGVHLLGDLDDDEHQLLDVYVHTRHVIGHNLGLVDGRFTDETDRAMKDKRFLFWQKMCVDSLRWQLTLSVALKT